MAKRTASLLFLLGLLIAVFLPQIFNPVSQLDGSWYYSQAVSIANGSFFYNHFTNTTMPLLFGWLQADLALFFPNALGLNLFYFIILGLFGYYVVKNRNFDGLSILLAAMLILDGVFHLHRPEPVMMILGIIGYRYAIVHQAKFKFLVLFGLLALLIHPPNGVLLIASILAYEGKLFRFERVYYILWTTAILTGICALYLFPENYFVETIKFRIENISLKTPIQFLRYSGLTLVFILVLSRSFWNERRSVNMLLLVLICTLLGAYYYYAFLMVPFILYVLDNEVKWDAPLMPILLFLSFTLSVVHPVFTAVENRAYGRQAYDIIERLTALEFPQKVFIENSFAPAIYDNPEVKMVLIDHRQTLLVDSLKKGDMVVLTSMSKLLKFRSFASKNYPKLDYEIIEEFAPVKGKLTLSSAYRKRTEPLALYILRF